MNRLLVNADDFGIHPLVNEAVVRFISKGIINSVSVMATAEFVDYSILKEFQGNGVFVGVHLSWLRSKWLTKGPDIFSWREFSWKLISGGKKFQSLLKAEAEAQIELLIKNGIAPDHLDSHQHVHHFPMVWRMVEDLASRYGIKRIRCCKVANKLIAGKGVGRFVLQHLASLKYNPKHHFCVAGLKSPGNYSFENIENELTASRGFDVEFIVHPAIETTALDQLYPDWHFDWKQEFNALQDERLPELITRCNFFLCHRDFETG